MKGVRVLILAFSVFSGLAAMWLVRAAIETRASTVVRAPAAAAAVAPEQAEPVVQVVERYIEAPTIDILVADRPIRVGAMLTPADFRWQPWPEAAVSEFYVVRGEQSVGELLENAAARLPMVKDEPLTPERYVKVETSGIMSVLLRDGMRAVSVPVSELTGAGGFIQPGDFVDVMLTRQFEIKHYDQDTGEVDRTEAHQRIDTILRTVRVLAIDQTLEGSENGVATRNLRTATLELSPQQVELVALTRQIAATERGEISLSLYSFSDLVRDHGQNIQDIMPETVLDLRQEAIQRQEQAERDRLQVEAGQRQRRIREDSQRVAAEAARRRREAEEARLRAEALELQMENARIRAEQERLALEAEAARQAALAAAAAAAAESGDAQPDQVTLLRNGRPINVQVQPTPLLMIPSAQERAR